MSAPPNAKPNNRRFNGKGGAGSYAKNQAQNLKYGTPLPILLPPSPLHPAHIAPPPRSPPFSNQKAGPSAVTPQQSISTRLESVIKRAKYRTFAAPEIPLCRGVYDHRTRSVWVTSRADRQILFERGFFGKGSLSRSDPSWHTRRVKVVLERRQAEEAERLAAQGGGEGNGPNNGKAVRGLTSEEVTAMRRKERKQFKIDRAQAMLDASLAAERILVGAAATGGQVGVDPAGGAAAAAVALREAKESDEEEQEDHETDQAEDLMFGSQLPRPQPLTRIPSSSSIATTTTTKARSHNHLLGPPTDIPSFEEYAHALPEGTKRLTPQTFLVRPTRPSVRVGLKAGPAGGGQGGGTGVTGAIAEVVDEADRAVRKAELERIKKEEEEELERQVDDMEHLQLTLEEAFFLSWAIGCLVVHDPATNTDLTPSGLLHAIFSLRQPTKLFSLTLPNLASEESRRPDHPFLVSYAAYHHYRSLGWVVKTGIKFCVDYLLYKKGLVFSHAEFAMLVIPHYADENDRASSPFTLPNGDPMTWQWLNTVNRVNTQVKKTLILAYVVIPPIAALSAKDWRSPEQLLSKFAVREITIRRFVAARMRD